MTNNIAAAVYYKLSTNREMQVRQFVSIRQNKTTKHKVDWQKEIVISTKYQIYREPFTSILLAVRSTRDAHLRRINIANHRIELLSPDTAPVHSTPYRASPKTREFKKTKIKKILTRNIVDGEKTKWAAAIEPVLKNGGTLQFFVAYPRFNTVTKRDSYPVPRTKESIYSLGKATLFSTLDASNRYCKI